MPPLVSIFAWELALGTAKKGTVHAARSSLGTVPIFAWMLALCTAKKRTVRGARSSLGTVPIFAFRVFVDLGRIAVALYQGHAGKFERTRFTVFASFEGRADTAGTSLLTCAIHEERNGGFQEARVVCEEFFAKAHAARIGFVEEYGGLLEEGRLEIGIGANVGRIAEHLHGCYLAQGVREGV